MIKKGKIKLKRDDNGGASPYLEAAKQMEF